MWNNRYSVLNPSDKLCSCGRTYYALIKPVKLGPEEKMPEDVPALTAFSPASAQQSALFRNLHGEGNGPGYDAATPRPYQ